jgi:hypothetical protein
LVVSPPSFSAVPTMAPSATERSSPTVPAAPDEHRGVGPEFVPALGRPLDVRERRLPARPGAGDDDRVREAALGRVGQRLRLVALVGKRRRVFHVHVREDADVARVDPLAESGRLVRSPLEDPLVGHASADVDVDADEVTAGGCGGRDRPRAVVPEDVDPDREVGRLADRPGEARQVGDDVRRDVLGVERGVAEVLDHQGVDAAGGEPFGVTAGDLVEALAAAPGVVAGRAGQRRQVDHPDDRLPGAEGRTRLHA